MSGAVVFVMAIASFTTAVLYKCLITVKLNFSIGSLQVKDLDISFTKILLFIVVIAALVQIVEILLQKFTLTLWRAGNISSAHNDKLRRPRRG
jgi:electron transport complex protein RnfA